MSDSENVVLEDLLTSNTEGVNDFDNLDQEGWLSPNVEATEESENNNGNTLIIPFDPKLVKIATETVTIYSLTQRLKLKQIDLYPNFQRKANLWDNGRKSRLIESLLLRFPIPAFYFDIEGEFKWLVVDGLQRLSTLNHFIVETIDPLRLEGLEILTELNGECFKGLDITLRQRILNTNITTFQIQEGTPKEVKYNLFRRINTGGLGLTPMEIRHALNQNGPATDFFKKLTNEENNFYHSFVKENKITTSRMEDRELALRYVAFSLSKYEDYKTGLGKFLDEAMEKLDSKTTDECNELVLNLEKSIDCYRNIFGNTRFGRGVTFTLRAKMNSALFEVWTSELAKLSDEARTILIAKKESIISSYRTLLSDTNTGFNKSIISSTAGKGAVETRFSSIHNLISTHLSND